MNLDVDFEDDLRLPLRHIEEQTRCLEPFADMPDSAHTLGFADTPDWAHKSGPQLGMVLDTGHYMGRC